MCAAARIFDAVRRKAAENNPDSKGQFDSIHVRRGDFQFNSNRVRRRICPTYSSTSTYMPNVLNFLVMYQYLLITNTEFFLKHISEISMKKYIDILYSLFEIYFCISKNHVRSLAKLL